MLTVGRVARWFWDPKVVQQIHFDELQYCNWNQTLTREKYYFQNHWPSDFAPSRPYTQRVGLFRLYGSLLRLRYPTFILLLFLDRDPRKRIVSAWNSHKHAYGAVNRTHINANSPSMLHCFTLLSCLTLFLTSRVVFLFVTFWSYCAASLFFARFSCLASH